MMTNLSNKVAVVTGASSGIGAGIVKELLKLEMKVVGLARRKEKVEELGKGYDGRLFALQADVTKEEDILSSVNWIEKNVGSIYVFVNNAGVGYNMTVDLSTTEDIKKVMNTNLMAPILFTREVIKSMKANDVNGIIINVNSIAGHFPLSAPGFSFYNTSKFGLTTFTESVRLELAKSGSKIKITSLSPGLVKSEMSLDFILHNPYLEVENIVSAVTYILKLPPNVNVTELIIRPVGEII